MGKKILIILTALAAAGCFFGGESDSPTAADPRATDTVPKIKTLVPGEYTADYSWLPDSVSRGWEAEFSLKKDGSYNIFWIGDNMAWYNRRGSWYQKDSALYFSGSMEGWAVDGGVFEPLGPVEDDTNSIVAVTATSFKIRDWTPLRQKAYWITYTLKAYPALKEDTYVLDDSALVDSGAASYESSILLKNTSYLYSLTKDSVDLHKTLIEVSSKYAQFGSFLVMEENRRRDLDTNDTFSDWDTFTGFLVYRMDIVSDNGFRIWHGSSFFSDGYWDTYRKKTPTL